MFSMLMCSLVPELLLSFLVCIVYDLEAEEVHYGQKAGYEPVNYAS